MITVNVNSKKYTDKHNDVMDALLFAYAELHSNDIQVDGEGNYKALNLEGQKILQHLCDYDLVKKF